MNSKPQVFLSLLLALVVLTMGCSSTRRTTKTAREVKFTVHPSCVEEVQTMVGQQGGSLSEPCAKDLLYNLHASLKR